MKTNVCQERFLVSTPPFASSTYRGFTTQRSPFRRVRYSAAADQLTIDIRICSPSKPFVFRADLPVTARPPCAHGHRSNQRFTRSVAAHGRAISIGFYVP